MNGFIKERLKYHLNESENINDLVNGLVSNIKNRYSVDLSIQYSRINNTITISKIVVPKDNRGTGIGTDAMRDIIKFADNYKLPILLTPSSDFGGSKNRLISFYKNFGFIPNKNSEYSETMVRLPK